MRTYSKIPKISPWACIFQRPFLRGLSTEGYLHFKIDWASLIVGSKLTVFAVLLCIWGQFSKYKPPGGLYLERQFNGGFFALPVWGAFILEGLIHGGAYFQNFMVFLVKERIIIMLLCHVYVGNQTSLEQQQKHQAPKQSSTGKKNSFLISKIINKRYTRTCSTSMQSSVSTWCT